MQIHDYILSTFSCRYRIFIDTKKNLNIFSMVKYYGIKTKLTFVQDNLNKTYNRNRLLGVHLPSKMYILCKCIFGQYFLSHMEDVKIYNFPDKSIFPPVLPF